jgi:hypothetical protein
VVLRAGLALSDLELSQLWAAYLGIGGSLTATELTEALYGQRALSEHEHDVVAQALNDYFVSRGQDHPVAYSDDLNDLETLSPDPPT